METALAEAKTEAPGWYVWTKRQSEPVTIPPIIEVEPSEVLQVT
jgi:hypothetical protein